MASGEQIITHLWGLWALICFEHERAALDAHAQSDPDAQFRASLVAICAAAFSLEAFFLHLTRERADRAQVAPGSPRTWISVPSSMQQRWKANRTRAGGRILDALKLGFDFRGSVNGNQWGTEFRWLFERRHGAVHWEEEAKPADREISTCSLTTPLPRPEPRIC